MIKAVIFDLDGVIVTTDEQHYLAWQALADRLGIPFDRQTNNRFRGVSRMACMDILAEVGNVSFSIDEKNRFATEKNEHYRSLLGMMSEKDLSLEVKTTLDRLRERGIKLAIGSSSKNAKFILEKIGLGTYFDAVSDGTNITRSKPDPEVFLKAADMLGVPYSECLVVEDAISGVSAGLNAGMEVATVGDAAEHGLGTYILTSFKDLCSIL